MNVVINTGDEVPGSGSSFFGANKTLRKTLHAIELSSGNPDSENIMRHPTFIGSMIAMAAKSVVPTEALRLEDTD